MAPMALFKFQLLLPRVRGAAIFRYRFPLRLRDGSPSLGALMQSLGLLLGNGSGLPGNRAGHCSRAWGGGPAPEECGVEGVGKTWEGGERAEGEKPP